MMTIAVLSSALSMMLAAPPSPDAEPSQTAETAAAAAVPPKPVEALETAPAQTAVEAEITDKAHPDYVRCKSEAVIGSRAKRKRTCMTNREWALVERRGNEQSKEFAGDNFAAGYN